MEYGVEFNPQTDSKCEACEISRFCNEKCHRLEVRGGGRIGVEMTVTSSFAMLKIHCHLEMDSGAFQRRKFHFPLNALNVSLLTESRLIKRAFE